MSACIAYECERSADDEERSVCEYERSTHECERPA
jgi:hypothetical protein